MRGAAVFCCLLVAGCAQTPATTWWESQYLPAAAILWAAPYSTLLVEVSHAKGLAPTSDDLDFLVDTLEGVTDKTAVVLEGPDELHPHDYGFDPHGPWNLTNANALNKASSRAALPGLAWNSTTAYLRVLILNGTGEGSNGFAFTNVIVLLPESIDWEDLEPDAETQAAVARGMMLHELGHVLGLVGAETPMQTPRLRGSHHSTMRGSIMYEHAAEGGPELSLADSIALLGRNRFDEHDLADLAAYREYGRRLHEEGKV